MLELVHDLCPDRRVESRARLVKHDEPYMRGRCSGDRDPLALPAAELVREQPRHFRLLQLRKIVLAILPDGNGGAIGPFDKNLRRKGPRAAYVVLSSKRWVAALVTGGGIGSAATGGPRPRTSSSGGTGMTIRNPIEWATDQIKLAGLVVGSASRAGIGIEESRDTGLPEVRRLEIADLRDVLARGLDDFAAYRTDVIFLCIVYPVVGLVLGRLAFGYGMLPLVFPIASGFALVGPFAAVGLYEMSRRREQGGNVAWPDAFGVVASRSFGAIVLLGLLLVTIFLFWLVAAETIYELTLGPEPPTSLGSFARDVFTTGAGWIMIVVGVGIGFLFALLVLVISVVSFPLLLDRDVGLGAGGVDIGARGGHQPAPDGHLGADRRRRPRNRVDTAVSRSDHCDARARTRHLALVPQGGAELIGMRTRR